MRTRTAWDEKELAARGGIGGPGVAIIAAFVYYGRNGNGAVDAGGATVIPIRRTRPRR